ncbi:MAG: glycosyltransferase family 1 protein [Planctomycetota bacterium]
MRVAVDATAFSAQPSGARTRLINLYSRVACIPGMRLSFFLTPGIELDPVLRDAGVESLTMPWKFPAGFRSFSRSNPVAQRADRSGQFDLYAAETVPLPSMKATPMAATLHDLRFLHPRFTRLHRWFFARFLLGRNLLRARAIVTVSHTVKNEILSAFPRLGEERVHVIPNGIPPVLHLGPEETREIRKRLKVRPPYLLCISHLEPRKNIRNLINAFAAFKKTRPSEEAVSLVLGGAAQQGIKESQVMEWGSQSGLALNKDLHLPGPLSEQERSALLLGACLVVQPSFYEGFGLGVLEAMHLGIPVACSSIPAHREVAGEGAFYFPPRNGMEMARVFTDALSDDPRKAESIKKASEQAKTFSWDRSAKKLAEIWERLVTT